MVMATAPATALATALVTTSMNELISANTMLTCLPTIPIVEAALSETSNARSTAHTPMMITAMMTASTTRTMASPHQSLTANSRAMAKRNDALSLASFLVMERNDALSLESFLIKTMTKIKLLVVSEITAAPKLIREEVSNVILQHLKRRIMLARQITYHSPMLRGTIGAIMSPTNSEAATPTHTASSPKKQKIWILQSTKIFQQCARKSSSGTMSWRMRLENFFSSDLDSSHSSTRT